MKLTNLSNLLVLGIALTISAVGCRKNPTPLTKLPQNETGPIRGTPPLDSGQGIRPGDGAGSGAAGGLAGGGPLGPGHVGWPVDPSDPLKQQTIYFDYDKSAIRASEQSKMESVANYLKDHPDVALRIDGNCDERGTEEYNRSLGERRSLAAREFLVGLGLDPNRIDSNTWGEDRPADPAHNEAAWSKNRRDEFVVLLKPKP